MLKQILKNLSLQESLIPCKQGFDKENYSAYADMVRYCADIDKYIMIVETNDFSITKHAYGHVKYLQVGWTIHKDFFKSVPKTDLGNLEDWNGEKLHFLEAFIADKVMLNAHDRHIKVYLEDNSIGRHGINDENYYYVNALVKESLNWHP